jgi:transcriptional regulator with XRE-family HTH domain
MAARLRDTRAKFGWSQGRLAELSDVSVEAIRQLEAGQCEPRTPTLQKLAAALCVRADWLLSGSGDMVDARHTTRDMQERWGVPDNIGSGPWALDDSGEWCVWRTCPHCRDLGFTYDEVEYDGFYSICQHRDGSGQLYRPELGQWTAYSKRQ